MAFYHVLVRNRPIETNNTDRLSVIIPPKTRRAAKLRLLNFLSLFRDLQKPTPFSGGGGVVAEFSCDLQAPTRCSGEGG